MDQLVSVMLSTAVESTTGSIFVPTLIADAGEQAARRFLEFFAATIRNTNTRMAYYRAVLQFFAWCGRYQLDQLVAIEPLHVAAYIEALHKRGRQIWQKLYFVHSDFSEGERDAKILLTPCKNRCQKQRAHC